MQQVVKKETGRVLVRFLGVRGRFRRVPCPGLLRRFVSDTRQNETSEPLGKTYHYYEPYCT